MKRFLLFSLIAAGCILLGRPDFASALAPIQFQPAENYPVPSTPFRMVSGDFNLDGWADLVVAHDNTQASILMNNGAGGFTVTSFTAGSRMRDAAVVQLPGDNLPDLVITDWNGKSIRIFKGAGNGTFVFSGAVSAGANAEGVEPGDFNRDGITDVAVCLRYALKVGVFQGTAEGSFIMTGGYPTSGCDDLTVGLVNSDGYQDIVTGNWPYSSVSVLMGNGNGAFAAANNISVGNANPDVAISDINHDGFKDLVIAAYTSKSVVIMLGNGAGGFSQSQNLPVGGGPNQIKVVDFNRDGFLDIAMANYDTVPSLSILPATGHNAFLPALTYYTDRGSNGMAIADFDHDGGLDVATTHPVINQVRVMKQMVNPDLDGDGLPNWWEDENSCLNALVADAALDPDLDGLNNGDEYAFATDPCLADTDGDLIPDGFESDNTDSGLDPLNEMDGDEDFDGDGNSNVNEYYNGTDPFTPDPFPIHGYPAGCYYWGKSDAGPFIGPKDIAEMQKAYAGVPADLSGTMPAGYDPMDVDRDTYPGPGDIATLQAMYAQANRPDGYPSSPSELTVLEAPAAAVAVGSTTHVTLSVHAQGPGAQLFSPGFGVVFWVSTGNAVLLGGEGSDPTSPAGNRYDISMRSDHGAPATMTVMVTGPGPVVIHAKIPACGMKPHGRWSEEVLLAEPVVVNP